MTDAERGGGKSAEEELLLWMRRRYAAAALDAGRHALMLHGKNDAGAELVHGRLTERGYEAIILSRDGMSLLRVCFKQVGDAQKETVEIYAFQGGAERMVEL